MIEPPVVDVVGLGLGVGTGRVLLVGALVGLVIPPALVSVPPVVPDVGVGAGRGRVVERDEPLESGLLGAMLDVVPGGEEEEGAETGGGVGVLPPEEEEAGAVADVRAIDVSWKPASAQPDVISVIRGVESG